MQEFSAHGLLKCPETVQLCHELVTLSDGDDSCFAISSHTNLCSVLIPFKLKQVMIVGIDCYHDTLSGKQSIAGFVASLNQTMTR